MIRLLSSLILLLTTVNLSAQAPDPNKTDLGPIRDASVLLLKASHEQQRLIDPVTYAIGRMTLDDAYTVQDRLCKDREEPVIGYKLAFASSAAQRRWNIDAPLSGRLFASSRVPEGGTLEAASFRKFMIEAEIAFVVGGDSSAVMYDPWNAYLWLSRHLIQRGTPLKNGDIVLSGAVAAAYSGSAGRVQGDYVATAGRLGELLFTLK
ncbi:MAG: hypothetical protein OSB41_10995 [Kiritimatiellae bacterium]|nr:hypothetical protein [Kiritimatiellia bacterium]